MESRSTFFATASEQPEINSWLRDIKRDMGMSEQEFDARMIEERTTMLALMRVGACVIAADEVLLQRLSKVSGDDRKVVKKEIKYLVDTYAAKVRDVCQYASTVEFMSFAENLSAYLIQKYSLTDPAADQEKIFMKYLTPNAEGNKNLSHYYGEEYWRLNHNEIEEIGNFLDFLVASDAWLSIKVILMHLPPEPKSEAIRRAAYLCKIAIRDGSVEVVKTLLSMGVNPNANVDYSNFLGGSQSVCLLVHLIAHVRSLASTLGYLHESKGVLVDGAEVSFKLANEDETIKHAIAKLHAIVEEMLRAGADVEQDEPSSRYSYESAWVGRMFPSVTNPEHLPRGMAAKTLREDVEVNDKLNAEQKQLLGDVLRLIINARKLEPVHGGGEAVLKKPKF